MYPIFFQPLPSFSHSNFDLSLVSNLLSTLTFFQPLALWLISCIQSSFHPYLLSATRILTYLLYPIFFPLLPSFSHLHFDLSLVSNLLSTLTFFQPLALWFISCIKSSFHHYFLSATCTLTYLLYPIFFPLLPSFSHLHFDLSLVSNLLSTITFFQPLALWLISCIQSSFHHYLLSATCTLTYLLYAIFFPPLPSFSHSHFDLISCIQSSFHPYLLSATSTLTYLLYPIFFPFLPSFSHLHFDLSLVSNLLSTLTFFQPLALWPISCIQSSFHHYLLSATCTLTYLLYPIFFPPLPSFSHLHFDLSLVSNLLSTITFFQPLALWLISCIQFSFHHYLLSATGTLTYLLYPIFFSLLPSFSHSHFDLSLVSNLLSTITFFQPLALWLISCIQSSFHHYLLSATRTLTYLLYPIFFPALPSFSHSHFDLSLVSNLLSTITFFQPLALWLISCIQTSFTLTFFQPLDLWLISCIQSSFNTYLFQPLALWLISCIQYSFPPYLLSGTSTLTHLLYHIFLSTLTFFQPLALWLISCIQSFFHSDLISASFTLTYLLYPHFFPRFPSFSHSHFDLSLVSNLLSTLTFFQPLALCLISCVQSFFPPLPSFSHSHFDLLWLISCIHFDLISSFHPYLLSATRTLTYLLYQIFFPPLPSFSHLHFDLSLVSNLLSALTFFQPLALWLISCIQSSFHPYLLSATCTLTYLLYPIFFPPLPSFSHSHFDTLTPSLSVSNFFFSIFLPLPSFSHLHFDLSLVSNLLSTLTFFQPLALWLISSLYPIFSCIQSSFHSYLLSATCTLTYLLYPIFFPPLPSFSHLHFDLFISCIQSSFRLYLLSATRTLTYLLYSTFFPLLPSFSHLHFDLSLVSNLLSTLTFFQPLALWLISCIQSSFHPYLLSTSPTLTYLLYPIFFPPLPSFSLSHFDLSFVSNTFVVINWERKIDYFLNRNFCSESRGN